MIETMQNRYEDKMNALWFNQPDEYNAMTFTKNIGDADAVDIDKSVSCVDSNECEDLAPMLAKPQTENKLALAEPARLI
ncbi:hypothetical protein P3T76_011704 [Phytophthora citrophthora]|uniref:Uncharacterized protein n=1 Tax=Phytophthora citrophthora TaxID=4793 RepID=A0AAD9G8X6_9STRA|nr:hypothetical protein P3T76_011704 [Phytophthora citrophthora]